MLKSKKVRVLIVDDSKAFQRQLCKVLERDPQIEVIGTADDAFEARDKIKALNPDVLTLDIEMPKMNGLTFLENLMRLRPMPVVMCAGENAKTAQSTMIALELGAVDFVSKNKLALDDPDSSDYTNLTAKVVVASKVDITRMARNAANATTPLPTRPTLVSDVPSRDLIAIGSSTGGTEALKQVLQDMPADSPAIFVAQHIPPNFSASFAARMNEVSPLQVCEAKDGQKALTGHAYIAPGGFHLAVRKRGAHLYTSVYEGDRVNRHMPSVEVLFDSAAQFCAKKTVAVMLTGMGKDGASAMQRLHDAGARTIAQDEKTSVVWGMPRAAIELGAADHILPLNRISERITELVETRNQRTQATG